AILAWVMMGLAIWHFAVFVPDRFWGGIVGAFLAAAVGALLFGLVVNGFSPPSRDDTSILHALEAIPGALIALAGCYVVGMRKGNEPVPH
ncbi:MAG TPA: hypothetical protein VLC53_03220, partial [Myxococcota bacterium]|nr:hypothetical protein [Myxococcota bacterium]